MAKNNYINILLISGSWIIGWLINYIYHPIMLKYLTIEQFWEFGSLVWMFNILGILTTGFVLFLNREISKNINNKEKIKFIFYESIKLFFILWVIIYWIYLLFSPFIANFLNINEIWLIYIVGFTIILAFLGISENAILRWLKKFEYISILSIIGPIIKLGLWFLLVYLWYKVYWAIIWFILAWFFWFFISFIYLSLELKNVKKVWKIRDLLTDFNNNKKDIFNFFIWSLFFAIFMNIDVILAKNIFDPKTAWIYAWISVLWKFLIFLLLSIETVYYSQIMEYKKEKLPSYLIKNPIFLLIITSILAILFNYFFGSFILWILKKDLKDYVNIYLLTLVYYSLIAFISFFSKILVWWWKNFINYIMWFLILLLLVIVYNFWNSLENFVYSFIFVWFLWTFLSFFIFYKSLKKSN